MTKGVQGLKKSIIAVVTDLQWQQEFFPVE